LKWDSCEANFITLNGKVKTRVIRQEKDVPSGIGFVRHNGRLRYVKKPCIVSAFNQKPSAGVHYLAKTGTLGILVSGLKLK
jgi:hypothetical protein